MSEKTYYKRTDTRVDIYYDEHKDMFKSLKPTILTLFKKYMSDYAIKRLKSIKHIEENGYKFKGVTDGWLDDYSSLRFKVNSLKLSGAELSRYMPTQAIFITSVIFSIYTDLRYLTYLYLEGVTSDYINYYTPDIDVVLSTEQSSVEIDYCRSFHSLGLAIPEMLMTEYNRLYSDVILAKRCENFYKNIGEDYNSYKDLSVRLIANINNQVMDGKLEVENKDIAYIAKGFKGAYMKCVSEGIEPVDGLLTMAKRKVYKVQGKKGVRLATQGEIESSVAQLLTEEEYLLNEKHYAYLVCFVYLCTGYDNLLDSMDFGCDLTDLMSTDTLGLLQKLIDYFNSTAFAKDLDKMRKAKEIKYPKSAADEIRDAKMDDKLKAVYDALRVRKETLSNFEAIIYDISLQGIRGKKLSDKQNSLITKYYNELVSGKIKTNVYSKELEAKVKACQSYFTYKPNSFFSNLFSTVLKTHCCSEKQDKYIEEEYQKMLDHQKLVLERENQYIVRNTKESKKDENRALEEANTQLSSVSQNTESADDTEDSADNAPQTFIFGEFVFEDVEA